MGNFCELQRDDLCYTHCTIDLFNITLCDEATFVQCHSMSQISYNNCSLGIISLILLLIIIIGAVGNVCVCAVIWNQTSMRTQTNYYLFSLAVSDLLILLGLPHTIIYMWHTSDMFGLTMCRIRMAISETGTYASVLTVVAFSVERYMAICHPFLTASSVDPLKRAVIVICAIWVVSILCSIPLTMDYVLRSRTRYPPNTGELSELSFVCGDLHDPRVAKYLTITTVLFFFIPMTILLAMYSQIAICIWKRKNVLESQQMQGQLHSDRISGQDRTTVCVLATVVVSFFISWFPLHLQRLELLEQMEDDDYVALYLTTEVLKYFSAAFNPVLYNIMSQTFRRAFKEAIITPSVRYRCGSNRVRVMSSKTHSSSLHSERNT